SLVANDAKTPAPTIVLAAKTESGVEVGKVIDQFVKRVSLVLERGSDGQAVPLGEEADHTATHGRHAGGVHEAETPPKQGHAGAGGQLTADRHEGALSAITRKD